VTYSIRIGKKPAWPDVEIPLINRIKLDTLSNSAIPKWFLLRTISCVLSMLSITKLLSKHFPVRHYGQKRSSGVEIVDLLLRAIMINKHCIKF